MNNNEIKIHINDFEGPLELLLHLIKQSKMDIYDINIKDITSQYVNVINKMKELNIDVAGEFFVLAANLMKIKSQLLLSEETEEELEEDPREDLVSQLLEYKQFKKASFKLQEKEKQRNEFHSKKIEINDSSLKLSENEFQIKLLKEAWTKILQRNRLQKSLTVENIKDWKFDIPKQSDLIKEKLAASPNKQLKFTSLFSVSSDLEELVTDFLAILKLVKDQSIEVIQAGINNEIIIKGV
ncbi:segregation/condensation protein A [Fructilactobacillus vespulae]|uniref:segregation and condensation protein A n=1 Tax=Fructilactobacillus vespulae TaxID=1249630 RepID=UPI0039B3A7CD